MFKFLVKEPREKKYLRRYLGKHLFVFLKVLRKEVFQHRDWVPSTTSFIILRVEVEGAFLGEAL